MLSPQRSRVLVVAAAATAAATAVHIYRRFRALQKMSTRALEAAAGTCVNCACELYLDAAVPEMRCPQCETATATLGLPGTSTLDSEGSIADFTPGAFDDPGLLTALQDEVHWEQHDDRLEDGRIVSQARLIAYQASIPGHVYSYPGIVSGLRASCFSKSVEALRQSIQHRTGLAFNSAHLNLYRDGGDHVSWHTDEVGSTHRTTREFKPLVIRSRALAVYHTPPCSQQLLVFTQDVGLYGDAPAIASVSFGATRSFVLRCMRGEPYAPNWVPSVGNEMVEYVLR